MKNIIAFLFLPACAAVFSCSGTEKQHTFYSRVVSLSPSVTRIIIDLERSDLLTGITPFCPKVKGASLVGNSIIPNVEKIISLNPDLVVMSIEDETMIKNEQIENAGIEILYLRENNSYDDIEYNYRKIAEKLNAPYSLKLISYSSELKSITTDQKSTSVILLNTSPMVAVSSSSFISDAAGRAGFKNIIKTNNPYPFISAEYFASLNADVILVSDLGSPDLLAKELKKMKLKHTPAIRVFNSENTCYYTPADFILSVRSFL